jgi:hypothetical protein
LDFNAKAPRRKVDEATAKSFWTAAGSEAPRRFGSSILSRKAVSPLRSSTAVQYFRNWSLIGFSELNFTSDLCAFALKPCRFRPKRFLAFFSPPGLF